MNGQVIENILRGINKQLGLLLESNLSNKNVAIVERCDNVGNKIYGFIAQKENERPTLTFYAVTGIGDLIEYNGVITQCN